MAYAERHRVSITTDDQGAGVALTPVVTGRIVNLIYTKVDYENGVIVTATLESTGQTLWEETGVNDTKVVAPKQPAHLTNGVAALFEDSGEPVPTSIWAANDRVKIEIASGGDTKSGVFDVVVA